MSILLEYTLTNVVLVVKILWRSDKKKCRFQGIKNINISVVPEKLFRNILMTVSATMKHSMTFAGVNAANYL